MSTGQPKIDFSGRGWPTDNAVIESFNGRFREECLNANWFASLDEARGKIDAWRWDYNENRPHRSLKGLTPREYAVKVAKGAAESLTWWSSFWGPLTAQQMNGLTVNEFARRTTDEIVAAGQAVTAGRPNYYLKGPRCFDDGQLRQLREWVDQHGAPAEVMAAGVQKSVPRVRRTRVCWLPLDSHFWVYDLVWVIVTTANQLLRFDIAPVPEQIQLARYDADDAGFFEWHADTVPSDLTRKISISVPLNPAMDYDGGVLELNQGTATVRVEQEPGAPIIFPSWLIHRVTPVTRGSRYSLVAWVRGPNWR